MHNRIHKILVTGGAGFIGSEFVRLAVEKNLKIIVVDKISYAGDKQRLKSVEKSITFYKTDISAKTKLETVFKKEKPDIVIHFAAETHVDRSIQDVTPFINANIIGTQNLIDLSRKYKTKKFLHISTDEVYGESQKGRFLESATLKPNNPYSATKTSAELLVRAAFKTYQLPIIIIRPANNYGPWQYPEKFLPVIITKALNNQKVPVYGKGHQIREWLHVYDCANAIYTILKKGKIGEIYNIGSYIEKRNIDTAKMMLKLLSRPNSLIQYVKDRPGHDFRYSVNCAKLRALGWKPTYNFEKGIKQTIDWYLNNTKWLDQKREYLKKYWQKVYKTK